MLKAVWAKAASRCSVFGEGGIAEAAGVEGGAAFADGFGEEAFGEGRGHQRADGEGAGGFAEDGDVGGVATEGGDVAVDPGDGGGLVQEAVVAGGVVGRFGGEFGMGEEAEDAEAVVHGDDDDVAVGEELAVLAGLGGAAGGEAAAVDPDHDGEASRAWRLAGAQTLRVRQSSLGPGSWKTMSAKGLVWMQWWPKSLAERVPFHLAAGCGGCQRRLPTGGAA